MNNYQEQILDHYLNSMGEDVIHTPCEILGVMKDCFAISRLQNDIWELSCYTDSQGAKMKIKGKEEELNKILSKYPVIK